MATKQAARDLIASLAPVEATPQSKFSVLVDTVKQYGAQDGAGRDTIIHAFREIFRAAKRGEISEGVDASTSKELYAAYQNARLQNRAFGTVEEAADEAKGAAAGASKFNSGIKCAASSFVGEDFIDYVQTHVAGVVSTSSMYERIVKVCRAQVRETKRMLTGEDIAELFDKDPPAKSLKRDLEKLFAQAKKIGKDWSCARALEPVMAEIAKIAGEEDVKDKEIALVEAKDKVARLHAAS